MYVNMEIEKDFEKIEKEIEREAEEVVDYIKIGLSAGMNFDGSEDHFLRTIKVVTK